MPEAGMSTGDMLPDSRTVAELIEGALAAGDSAQNALIVLHGQKSHEVYAATLALAQSECPRKRRLAAGFLGELGMAQYTFPVEGLNVLLAMLRDEQVVEVLEAVLLALAHYEIAPVLPDIIRSVQHSDPKVRRAGAIALAGCEDRRAIDQLVSLSQDADARVRDWATCGLGSLSDLNIPQVCDALAARLEDPDADTRAEALMGLAVRGDHRVVAALQRELTGDEVGTLVVEAAKVVHSPELGAALEYLRTWWDVDPALLDEAIAACGCSI